LRVQAALQALEYTTMRMLDRNDVYTRISSKLYADRLMKLMSYCMLQEYM
jgi:hypothetical protein